MKIGEKEGLADCEPAYADRAALAAARASSTSGSARAARHPMTTSRPIADESKTLLAELNRRRRDVRADRHSDRPRLNRARAYRSLRGASAKRPLTPALSREGERGVRRCPSRRRPAPSAALQRERQAMPLIPGTRAYRASIACPQSIAPRAAHEAAEPLYERALAITEKTPGADHPGTLTVKGDLDRMLAGEDSRAGLGQIRRIASGGDFGAVMARRLLAPRRAFSRGTGDASRVNGSCILRRGVSWLMPAWLTPVRVIFAHGISANFFPLLLQFRQLPKSY